MTVMMYVYIKMNFFYRFKYIIQEQVVGSTKPMPRVYIAIFTSWLGYDCKYSLTIAKDCTESHAKSGLALK
jgi:hypothetical protein